ncbi:hypothetical protein C1H46_015651 [Malus baccata]|uniref:PGG domain-containing protein n=1 Tax=Malus baccata TaxID=106549 RepID=A0A540MKM2_MALBA|nr:hypothetical protein C1H46_015651 [Malus baccata]
MASQSTPIEELKRPYQDAIKGNWTGVVQYYEKNRDKLVRPMNLDGDNVLHLAASSCSKSQCQGVLKKLIDLSSDSTKSRFLRVLNIDGNNVLHQVSVSGSVEAAKFLVTEFNKPVASSTGNNALPLLRTRNHLGETPLYRAAAIGHIDLVKFYLETLKEEKVLPEIYWQQLFRDDKLSGLRMAVVGQHFEIAHLLLQSYPYLGEMKDENGLTSLQLLAQMPTAFKPHFQQSLWKMLIYHCLPVREDVDTLTPNQSYDVKSGMDTNYPRQSMDSTNHQDDVESGMDTNHLRQSMDSTNHQDDVKSGMDTNHPRQSMDSTNHQDDLKSGMDTNHPRRQSMDSTNHQDDVKSGMDTNHPRQSIFRKKLADSEVHDGIIYRIWKDKKNKKFLKKLIKLLVASDSSWPITDKQENKRTISLGPFKKDGDDGGEKGTQSDKTIDDGGEMWAGKRKNKEAIKKEKETESDKTKGDDGADKKKEAAKKAEETKLDKTNGDDGGDKKKKATKKEEETESGNKQKEATKLKEEARKEVYHSTPLLIASVTGNVPIVQEILEQHPQAVEHVNEKEHNILHLAIKNRQKKIFDLIKSNLTVMSKLSKRIDSNGNTILHQAADRSYYSVSLSQKLIGPAMQLQDELRWFQRVKEILPPHYTIHHNEKVQTADELFNYWHDDLLEQAQKWVKETAQSCSTVAVLVATVVFAAAYTIPGGTNDQNGLPLLQNDPLFLLFTSMDVVAIASSLSSVAFFLSILSSPLDYPLFVNSIPNKVMAGFIFLFISMATTMLAFAATILLLIRVEKKWTKSLLYPIAFFPVPLFGLLQFPMYQSFQVMFHEINAWFFKPLHRFFKTLPYFFLYFLGFRRSLWCKKEA